MEVNGTNGSGLAGQLNLTELPNEIILQIFKNLDLPFLHSGVSLVCKKFNNMIYDELVWKRALYKNLLSTSTRYPYIEKNGLYSTSWRSGRDLSWRQLYMSLQRAKREWFADRIEIPVETTTSVIHLMKDRRYFLTGSRERTLQLWNLENRRPLTTVPRAHNGWLSAIAMMQENVVSCGWDSYIKVWSLAGNLQPLNSFLLDTAVMAVCCQPQFIAACTFPHLVLIDPRIGRVDWQSKHTLEGGSLMQLQFWNNSIVVTSRNRRLIQFDLRMNRVCLNEILLIEAAPNVLEIYDEIFYIGDCEGKVHLLDPYDRFKIIETLKVCPRKSQVRVLAPRRGYMIVGTSRGDIRTVMSMKSMENQTKVLTSSLTVGDICAGHCRDDRLALLTSNNVDSQIVMANI